MKKLMYIYFGASHISQAVERLASSLPDNMCQEGNKHWRGIEK
jgi:hypothetical protein